MKRLISAGAAILSLAAAIALQTPTANAAAPVKAAAADAGDAVKGKTLFQQRCGICHGITPAEAAVGPSLGGVVGRKAATEADFAGYSKALKASALTWTPANLDTFLTAPAKMVPGTLMAITNAQAKDRADLIAFLATTKN